MGIEGDPERDRVLNNTIVGLEQTAGQRVSPNTAVVEDGSNPPTHPLVGGNRRRESIGELMAREDFAVVNARDEEHQP